MKKILTFIVAVLLMQTVFMNQTFAETKEEKFAGKVKTEIAKLGTGTDARIKVKLKDGSKIKGFVSEVSDNQFVVTNTETGQNTAVPYSGVKQVKGNNLSTGVTLLIGLGVLLAAVLIIGSLAK